jgi:hypothetical protein
MIPSEAFPAKAGFGIPHVQGNVSQDKRFPPCKIELGLMVQTQLERSLITYTLLFR